MFGDEDVTSVECYTETFNYTYKVSVSGWSRLCGWIHHSYTRPASTCHSLTSPAASAGAKFWSQQVQRDGGCDHAAEDSASSQAQTAAAGWLAGTMLISPLTHLTLESRLHSFTFTMFIKWLNKVLTAVVVWGGLTLFVHPQVTEVLNLLFLCSHLMVCVHSAIKPSPLLTTVMSLKLPSLNSSSSSSRPPPPVEWYIHTRSHTRTCWWTRLTFLLHEGNVPLHYSLKCSFSLTRVF